MKSGGHKSPHLADVMPPCLLPTKSLLPTILAKAADSAFAALFSCAIPVLLELAILAIDPTDSKLHSSTCLWHLLRHKILGKTHLHESFPPRMPLHE